MSSFAKDGLTIGEYFVITDTFQSLVTINKRKKVISTDGNRRGLWQYYQKYPNVD